MKVFLHTRSQGKYDWKNESREFGRLPVVGEYLVTDWDSSWYQVQLVAHCPYEGAEYEAEVFAVEVDHMAEKNKAFSDVHQG